MDNKTKFVKFDARRCKACWNCIESCPAKVIDKINFLWHKHARIRNTENCMGCLQCVKICEYGAFRPYIKKKVNE